jgi:hypothetical protein
MPRSEEMSERSSCRATPASGCSDSTAFRLSSTSRLAPVASTAWPIWAASVSRLYGSSSPVGRSTGEASTKRHWASLSQVAMSKPRVLRLSRRSVAGSSRVTKTPPWPARTPSARNWPPNTVLALPAWPATTVARARGRPPMVTWSNPGMPVASLATDAPASWPSPPSSSRPAVRAAPAADCPVGGLTRSPSGSRPAPGRSARPARRAALAGQPEPGRLAVAGVDSSDQAAASSRTSARPQPPSRPS